ncbi:hypothetical protein BDB00DRAFT_853833 [Zychaea mexicana]|uniref:uncharacterized protein n=1 Tax=Zychaea mexicana TaxID=64656 RepID=UPI0022FED8F9|nr:uncharacterized protein BDB00DRAFT_853833 [Zychaea mexicana]KAI9484734.1 hypothetical protein BDB00DRAFT_853833 [Zychaea mexicana]
MLVDTQQPTDTTNSTAVIQRRTLATALAIQQSKAEPRWPQILVGKLRLVKSTWSLSSAWSSDTPEPESECPTIRDTEGQQLLPSPESSTITCPPPPPSYSDPSHPWAVRPYCEEEEDRDDEIKDSDEEEENEELPPYECTVSRVGHVHVKKERESQDKVAKKRSWKNLYVMLWGTSIRAYKREPKKQDETPVWSYTMQEAEAGMATDYRKYSHVLRIRIHNGPQFLVRCDSERSAVLWIDAVQASANVSPDLDTRPMPEFTFGRRQRRNRRRT